MNAKPKTRSKLDMFEPITFPIDKPRIFLLLSTETNNSGKDVPKPITIRPIKEFRNFKSFTKCNRAG